MNTRPPIAIVGPDRTSVALGSTVTLDGTASAQGSGDPFSNPLTYQWILLTKPAGSQATLSGANTATPGVVVDVAGDYMAQLIVRDNFLTSAPETVVVSTTRPIAEVSVTAPDASASEIGPDPGTLVFTRTGGDVSRPLTIHYVSAGTAGLGLVDGDVDDFGQQSIFKAFNTRTLTIPAHETSVTVTVTPFADGVVEAATERLTVNLMANRAYAVAAGTATIAIEDNPTVLELTSSDNIASEAGVDTATFTFTRSGGNLALALPICGISVDGTATEGADFQFDSFLPCLSIPANQTSVTITVTPVADSLDEGAETLTLIVRDASNFKVAGSGAATATIVEGR